MKVYRFLCFRLSVFFAIVLSMPVLGQKAEPLTTRPNLAIVATSSGSNRYGAPLNLLNDGLAPIRTGNMSGSHNRRLQPRTMQWVEYEWKQPVSTREIAVYWWN